MKRFDKRDIACDLLDGAVVEHLDHSRHFAAYSLAAVAEELASKLVQCDGKRAVSDVKIGALKAMSKAVGQPEGKVKGWRKLLFNLKNSMKHIDGAEDQFLEANIETSARQKIGDAIRNLQKLGVNETSQVSRYNQHRLARKRERDAL